MSDQYGNGPPATSGRVRAPASRPPPSVQTNGHRAQRGGAAPPARRACAGVGASRDAPTMFELQRQMMEDEVAEAKRETAKTREDFGGTHRPREPIDIKELLKREAFASRAASCDDHFEKHRPCPSKIYGISDQYIILDSAEKTEASRPDRGELAFNFMVQGVTRNQDIGVRDQLDTVIEIQVMPFCIPLLPEEEYILNNPITNPALPRLVANPGPPPAGSLAGSLTQLPYCSRVTMLLKEIGLQSITDASEKRHHFEFEATLAGPNQDRILLTPIAGHDTYVFTDPIKDIHGLTVCFFNPFERVNLPADVLYGVTATSVTTPPFLDLQLLAGQTHNVVPGDRIFVRGMATANAPINNYVNRREGLVVGPGVTPTEIPLNPDVDTTPLGAPPFASSRIELIIAKNRIRIPLRLRRVVDRLTNYIAP
jgi:hypothetical protein